MLRNFPTTNRRLGTTLAACGALVSVVLLQVASADELEERENEVRGEITQAERHLDQSSDRLVAATRALDAAQARLDSARRHLVRTRGELAAAEAFDQAMQVRLETAIVRLGVARADLANGREEVSTQEQVMRQIAVQNYQAGDPGLLGLSMVLTSQRPAELTSQLNSLRSVLDKAAVTLDRLDAARVLLTVQEHELEEAKGEVADQRKAAAENLEHKAVLESQAQAAETIVSDLVAVRARANEVAAAARAQDLRRLRALERERGRIAALLETRAEAARRRAAARPSPTSQPDHGFLSYPVDSYITSPYGMRFHPVYHRWALHDGTDFGAACGTPILAAVGGTVVATYYNAGYGNRVIVDNGFHRGVGLGTAYNHLSSDSTFVGERVERGEVIGYAGTTGFSTGCHLHFMVFENGATVDPMNWL